MLTLNKFSSIKKFAKRQAEELCKPLLTPIILAVITLAGLSLIYEIAIVHFVSYTFRTDKDRRAFRSNKIIAETKIPAVWHFGGSAFNEAVDEDSTLESKVNGKLRFINLSSNFQTPIESLALMRKANIKRGDIVIVHASLTRLNRVFPPVGGACTPDNLLLFYKDFVAAHKEFGLSQDEVPDTCYLTLFTRQTVINTIVKNLLNGKKYIPDADRNGLGAEKRAAGKNRPLEKKPERKSFNKEKFNDKNFHKTVLQFNSKSADLYKRIIRKMNEHVKAKGTRLILLDLPQNTEWYKNYFPNSGLESSLKKYSQTLKGLAAEGIPYYNFRRLSGYTFDDFSDHIHFVQTGRDKFYPVYMSVILPFFKGLDLEG